MRHRVQQGALLNEQYEKGKKEKKPLVSIHA
jgi:hypothetical protein